MPAYISLPVPNCFVTGTRVVMKTFKTITKHKNDKKKKGKEMYEKRNKERLT